MQTASPSAVSAVLPTSSSAAPRCARLGCGRIEQEHSPSEGVAGRTWGPLAPCRATFLPPEAAALLPWGERLDMPRVGSQQRPAAEVLTSYGYPLGVRVPYTRRVKVAGMMAGKPGTFVSDVDGGAIHNPFRFADDVGRHNPETPNAVEFWLEAHAGVLSKSTGQTGGAALLADWTEAAALDAEVERVRAEAAEAAARAEARRAFKAGLLDMAAGIFPARMVLDFIAPEDVPTWTPATAYRPGQRLTHAGGEFVCWTGGTSGTVSTWADASKAVDFADGSVTWRRLTALEATRQWVRQVSLPLTERDAPLLVLVGGVGGGKSSAGVVALMEHALGTYDTAHPLSLSAPSVVFWNAPEVARRGLYGREVDASMREAVDADVLVIDDVGAEFSTTSGGAGADAGNGPWLAMLDEVVNRRHQECRLTLITSNLEGPTFRQRYGQRIADRTRDGGRVLSVGTPSMRRKRPADAVPCAALSVVQPATKPDAL